jgi:tetratricopeptide (TPR) repeat protein
MNRIESHHLRALWDFGDPATSAQRFEEAEAAEADPDRASEWRTQRARALGLQDQFDAANALLDSIESESPLVRGRIALERGRLRTSAGDAAAAVPFFEEARSLFATTGASDLDVDALHMLAIADSERSVEWAEAGLAIARTSDDPETARWQGPLLNNLGWTLHDRGDLALAMSTFQVALGWYETHGTPDQLHIAHWSVARCLRSLGRLEEALAIQTRLAAEDPYDTYVAEELAILQGPDTETS